VDVRDRMGFLVEDWNRRRLFFHQSAVAAPTLGELRMGDRVQYERGLDPKNRACAMQVIRLSSAQPAPGNQLSPEAQPMTQEAPTTTEPMPETALSPEPPDDLPSTVPQS
jgi:cold shock CspA family protein